MLISFVQYKIRKFGKFLEKLGFIWYALSSRRHAQICFLQSLSVISAFCEVVNIGATLPFLNLVADSNANIVTFEGANNFVKYLPNKYRVLLLGIAFIVIVIISVLLRIFTIHYQLKITAAISTDIGVKVFTSLLSRHYSWHTQNNSSKLLAYLTNDVDQLSNMVQAVLALGVNLTLVLALGIALTIVSPKLIPPLLLLLILLYYSIFIANRSTISKYSSLFVSNYQKSIKTSQEAIGSIRDIIIDSTEHYFVNQYYQSYESYRSATAKINSIAQSPRYLIEGFLIIAVALYAIVIAFSDINLKSQLPMIGVLALGSYRILGPVQQCYGSVNTLQSQKISIARLMPFLSDNLDTTPKLSSVESLSACKNNTAQELPLICFEDVCFSYQVDSKEVLKNVNLDIFRGERIIIAGSTGCGKSTFADLILGLLEPTKGTIYANGSNLNHSHEMMSSWQSKVSHVPQHIYLIDSTIAENIAFAHDLHSINDERLQIAAEQSQLLDMIKSTTNGFQTVIGERGIRLSGGQRQRIGVARALYKDSDIIILDEATSALDINTESEILQAINKLRSDITIIMIAHRLASIKNSDRIIYIDNGHIEADGSFNELVDNSSKFRAMINYESQ